MKVVDLFVKHLEQLGVKYIFGVQGDIQTVFLDKIWSSKTKFITIKNESYAAFAVDQYARVSWKYTKLFNHGRRCSDGVVSVTATLKGNPLNTAQSGNEFSVVIPSSVTDTTGTHDLEFCVTGELANGGNDAPVMRNFSVEIEPVISSPVIDTIETVNTNDNDGGLASTFQITV